MQYMISNIIDDKITSYIYSFVGRNLEIVNFLNN